MDTGAVLDDLRKLLGRRAASSQEAIAALPRFAAKHIGVRSSCVTYSNRQERLSHVMYAYNVPGGCTVAAGAIDLEVVG